VYQPTSLSTWQTSYFTTLIGGINCFLVLLSRLAAQGIARSPNLKYKQGKHWWDWKKNPTSTFLVCF
jgi:hypothetical protein